MPKPPSFDDLSEISFITNYFIQGCFPPYYLVAEFSKEPIKDLILLMILPDMEDIVKAWLRPRMGRQRTPRRHGRKRPGRGLTLDPNELVGGRFRARYPEWEGIKLPGSKALFMISDVVDRFNWTFALIEGFTDVGFETLWGILSAHPEHCPNFSGFSRQSTGFQDWLGAFGGTPLIGMNQLDYAQNWPANGPVYFTHTGSDWTLAAKATVFATAGEFANNLSMRIFDVQGNEKARGHTINLEEGDSGSLAVEYEAQSGEELYVGYGGAAYSCSAVDINIMGFSGTWL